MMIDKIQPVYRDEESVVLDLVEDYFATLGHPVYTGDRTPTEGLTTLLGDTGVYVRAGRVGGAPANGEEHTDRPVVDVDVYANTRGLAKLAAGQILQLLLSHPHPIDTCTVLMAPQRVGWDPNSPIERFYSSYHLGLRR